MTLIEQFIELMGADERLTALYKLMEVLPPSAVTDTYATWRNNFEGASDETNLDN